MVFLSPKFCLALMRCVGLLYNISIRSNYSNFPFIVSLTGEFVVVCCLFCSPEFLCVSPFTGKDSDIDKWSGTQWELTYFTDIYKLAFLQLYPVSDVLHLNLAIV